MITPSWRLALESAALTMVAVLGSLGTVVLLGHVVTVPTQVAVLAVVLSLMLGRSADRGTRFGVETGIEMALISLVAAGVAWLLLHVQTLGEVLLVLGLSIGIFARRYGGVVRRAGRIASLPFLALLVTPVPVVGGGGSTAQLFLWSPVGALVALIWTAAVSKVLRTSQDDDPEPPPRASRRKIDVPTRMGAQMLVGLGAAMVLGRVLFDERWAWCVLSAFIVATGNRGRGDVAHKAVQRVVGAAIGTVGATVATVHVPAGHRSTLVALFVVMAVALVLRSRSYAFWAAGMTAMLSLLHAYYGSFGQTGPEQLRERLIGVVVGSVLALASAWFVLPVRTRDVFRSRMAAALRALTDHDGTFPAALDGLDELVPTLRAGARRDGRSRRQLAAVLALHDLPEPEDERALGALRHDVVRIRRSMVGKDDPAVEELLPELRPVLVALEQ